MVDKRLWTGIAQLVGGGHNSTALVGTPEQVADALLDYYDLGVRNFLIRGFDPLNDAADYGRALLPEADKSITEITCHGAGAAFLCPGCDTVIDIGGQDSKVILLDPSGGQVKDFLMNDKCAAGTGRFLEMTMSRVGSDITSIDTFVEGAEPVTINSMCAVFAESEIIGLLAQETPPGSIALGCIYSICRRTAIFAQKLAPEHPKVFFSGGLAQSQVVREVLARYLGVESVTAHPLCQYNGAIGAAVLGWKRVNR